MSGGPILGNANSILGNAKMASCDDAAARAALAAFLLRKVPHDTAKIVGRGTATQPGTVYRWINGEAFPSGLALIRLWRLFGVELLIEVFGTDPARLEALLAKAVKRRALMAEIDALDRAPV